MNIGQEINSGQNDNDAHVTNLDQKQHALVLESAIQWFEKTSTIKAHYLFRKCTSRYDFLLSRNY